MTGQAHPAEFHHPLANEDDGAIAAMRAELAPLKGGLRGPDARASFDDVMEHVPDAGGITYEAGHAGGIPGVWARPGQARPGPVILFLHGGAYVLGSAQAFRHFAGQVAARTRAPAFVADYRLAPEHPFPAALDDATAACRGLVETGARSIALVGDSAGGGLALALLAALHADEARLSRLPCAAAVMSPWTDLALTGPSLRGRAADDPFLTEGVLAAMAALCLNGHDPRDPRASPLYGRRSGLAPVQVHVGTHEVLLDDARRYAASTRCRGNPVALHVWEGMSHVFPSSVGRLVAAGHALDLIGAFLAEWLHHPSPVRTTS